MYDETETLQIEQQQQSSSQTEDTQRTGNPIASQIVVDWEVAQAILYVIQERTSLLIGHQLKLDEDVHIETFHKLFLQDRLGFWTIIDQLHDYLLTLDWTRVLDDIALIQHLLKTLKPLKCTLTEAEFVQILLLKLWPQPTTHPSQPPPLTGETFTNDVTSDVTDDASDDVTEDAPTEDEEEERQRLARNEVIRLAVENVYTWEAVEKIIVLVDERITAKVGRDIRFDQKHIEGLRGLYERDPLCFWSVFDQIQDKMMKSDWTKVRNDARFIQSFMNKYEPIDVLLTPFMADAIPQHSLVPKAYPPHVLYKKDMSTFKPIQKENCLYNSKYYRKQQMLHQQQQQQDSSVQDGVTTQQDNMMSSPLHSASSDANSSPTIQHHLPYPPCQFSQYNYFQDQIQQDQSKSNPSSSAMSSSPSSSSSSQSSKIITNVQSNSSSNMIPNNNNNVMFNNNFNTNANRMNTNTNHFNNYTNNDTNYTSMSSSSSQQQQMRGGGGTSSSSDIKAKPYQRYQQNNNNGNYNNHNNYNNYNNHNNHNNNNNYNNNNNNNGNGNNNNGNNNGSKQVHFVYSWNNAQSAINEIERRIMDNFSSVDIVFEDCHRDVMRARWEADPKGFFSILDQINTKFSQINWDTVTTKTKYINSIISKYEPQSVLSRFIQKFITPPDMAAATARV